MACWKTVSRFLLPIGNIKWCGRVDQAFLYFTFGFWLPVDGMKQTKVTNVDKIEEEKEGEEGQGEKTEGEEKEVAGMYVN